jgi:cytochrome P450
MTRLVDEIRNSFAADQDIMFSKTAKLEYLAAVIEESLRVYPPFVTSLARIIPRGGDTVAGH